MALKKTNQYVEKALLLSDKASSKDIAGWLWLEVNKNNDYKHLELILKEIEIKFAEKQGKKLAYVRCKEKPSQEILKGIEQKLQKRYDSEIILKHIPDKKMIGGFKIEVCGQTEDLSLNNSLDRLKRVLS